MILTKKLVTSLILSIQFQLSHKNIAYMNVWTNNENEKSSLTIVVPWDVQHVVIRGFFSCCMPTSAPIPVCLCVQIHFLKEMDLF